VFQKKVVPEKKRPAMMLGDPDKGKLFEAVDKKKDLRVFVEVKGRPRRRQIPRKNRLVIPLPTQKGYPPQEGRDNEKTMYRVNCRGKGVQGMFRKNEHKKPKKLKTKRRFDQVGIRKVGGGSARKYGNDLKKSSGFKNRGEGEKLAKSGATLKGG